MMVVANNLYDPQMVIQNAEAKFTTKDKSVWKGASLPKLNLILLKLGIILIIIFSIFSFQFSTALFVY